MQGALSDILMNVILILKEKLVHTRYEKYIQNVSTGLLFGCISH